MTHFHLIALTSEDLLQAIDYNADQRSGRSSASLVQFNNKIGVLDFVSRSSDSKTRKSWRQRIRFDDWDTIVPDEFKEIRSWNEFLSKFPEIVRADVRVGCTCPWFQYGGSAYILDQLDAGEPSLVRYKNSRPPEGRFPSIKDPGLEHTLCKHLIFVLRRYF